MKQAQLFAAMEATWPPARTWQLGPFCLRDGAGGGKRVSAASLEDAFTPADLEAAEAAMAPPLFLIRPGEEALDSTLAARGYRVVDPVLAYAMPVAEIAPPERMTTFPHWPPMAIARALWADAGISAARLAVMERAAGPKCVILGRVQDRAAGVAYVACHGETAMLHALEVVPALRRQGSAHNILRAAAAWALDQGAVTLALVVTEANAGARGLYASLGMKVVGQYHYRQK